MQLPAKLKSLRCGRTTEAVFSAASDRDSLARRLSTAGSLCATYLISIPPEQAQDGTWTQPRSGEAERIRALGPQFHALAETRVDA